VRSDPGGVVIGSTADGTLTTTNGASIFSHAQGFVVGGNRNVTGTATVTGPGSNWETRHQIEVGHYGTGNLEINGGATVECDLSFVGYKSGSVGNVTVTGENSYFDAGLSASFGHEGEGRLTVLDGAHVRAGLASIGEKAGSHGIVRVSGRDTLLEVGEGLMVGGNNLGPGGQGELIVDDAGVAKLYGLIWDALRVYPAGTITLRGGEISASSTVVFEPGSVLRGAGLLELFGLESSIAGTIRPGIETVGVIEVELEHSPLDFADTTELQIQLDSPASGHDALHVNGTLNVDGVLTVELLDGFHPAPYSQFDIVTAVPNRHGIGGLVGQFDDLQLPPLRPGFDWQWEYTDTALTLTAVPEPSALALTAIALALAAIARRRR